MVAPIPGAHGTLVTPVPVTVVSQGSQVAHILTASPQLGNKVRFRLLFRFVHSVHVRGVTYTCCLFQIPVTPLSLKPVSSMPMMGQYIVKPGAAMVVVSQASTVPHSTAWEEVDWTVNYLTLSVGPGGQNRKWQLGLRRRFRSCPLRVWTDRAKERKTCFILGEAYLCFVLFSKEKVYSSALEEADILGGGDERDFDYFDQSGNGCFTFFLLQKKEVNFSLHEFDWVKSNGSNEICLLSSGSSEKAMKLKTLTNEIFIFLCLEKEIPVKFFFFSSSSNRYKPKYQMGPTKLVLGFFSSKVGRRLVHWASSWVTGWCSNARNNRNLSRKNIWRMTCFPK